MMFLLLKLDLNCCSIQSGEWSSTVIAACAVQCVCMLLIEGVPVGCKMLAKDARCTKVETASAGGRLQLSNRLAVERFSLNSEQHYTVSAPRCPWQLWTVWLIQGGRHAAFGNRSPGMQTFLPVVTEFSFSLFYDCGGHAIVIEVVVGVWQQRA
ncbi:hypothetical protein T4B_14380 [Trichinella pseudospiralis]|uniref:Secreted protein n=1 Tax=Trichinella pseudospiralis TaxID=6337 RepID=A0A0V1JGD6_TRIPS|nr:hypothetical protein T4B_14380 [Trichinella pseudospiralis]